MDEYLLHYIWKTQSFRTNQLFTTEDYPLKVFYPGSHNHDSGPDFSSARIKIGNVEWIGHVEIHENASDWYHHGHQGDPAYDNVILHVVWKNDKEVKLENGEKVPTLELKDCAKMEVFQNYQTLNSTPGEKIPCHKQLKQSSDLAKLHMVERSLVERLETKAEDILRIFRQCGQNWEETSYRLLGRSFGLRVNKEAFLRLTETLPLNIIRSHKSRSKQIQSVLFGQAGFLEESMDPYQAELKNEFDFLRKKYNLSPLSRHHWKFSKLRPYSFPTMRIARFALFIENNSHLHTTLLNLNTLDELQRLLNQNHSLYWQEHTDFGKKSKKDFSKAGRNFTVVLILNAIVPLLAASARYFDRPELMEKAISWLESLPFEKNSITGKYESFDFQQKTAADSQGQIQLFHEYCLKKKCLSCNIGLEIFKLF